VGRHLPNEVLRSIGGGLPFCDLKELAAYLSAHLPDDPEMPGRDLDPGPDDLEAAFRCHARDLSAGDVPSMPRTVALDGKTLRGSFDHLTDRKAVHVLSAFASDAALVLAHQELAGAPDEVAAVPQLMAELGVTGVLFTADALHCQKDGFAQAAATGNSLLVRVKDN